MKSFEIHYCWGAEFGYILNRTYYVTGAVSYDENGNPHFSEEKFKTFEGDVILENTTDLQYVNLINPTWVDFQKHSKFLQLYEKLKKAKEIEA